MEIIRSRRFQSGFTGVIMEKKFAVLYSHDGLVFESVFPGLTGDYAWALKVAYSTWTRDGKTITPEMMRIYELERGNK